MFKRLRKKMLWFNMAVTSLVMLAAFATIYAVTFVNIQKDIERKLANVLPSSLMLKANNGLPGELGVMPEGKVFSGRLSVEYTPSFVLIMDNDGQLVEILSQLDLPADTYDQAAAQAWGKQKGALTLEGRHWQYSVAKNSLRAVSHKDGTPIIIDNETYQIAFLDVTASTKTLMQLTVTFCIVAVLMLAVLYGISSYFARRSVQPLEKSWEKQKQFVADASHELKTPLAIIGANMDAIEASGEETVASQKEWFGYIRSELGRLSSLIGDLLYLAQSEDAKGAHPLPFDLSCTVATAVASMEALIYDKNITLHTNLADTVLVKGDAEKIQQAVLVLLDNAAKYTPENGKITVSLKKSKGRALLQLANTGQGIAPEDLPRIFDRFYRPDASRSQESGGYGLGLAIAKTIVERAGGEISVRSILGLTTFTLALKIYQ